MHWLDDIGIVNTKHQKTHSIVSFHNNGDICVFRDDYLECSEIGTVFYKYVSKIALFKETFTVYKTIEHKKWFHTVEEKIPKDIDTYYIEVSYTHHEEDKIAKIYVLASEIPQAKQLVKRISKLVDEIKNTPADGGGKRDYNLFEEFEDGYILAYSYEPRIVFLIDTIEETFPLVIGNAGKTLDFVQEPENPYDEKAIAIYLNSNKIGYVHRGGIQDMIHDCIMRNWRFWGYLNKYSIEEKTATYKIASYKPHELYVSKQFSLIKTRKRVDASCIRADNLLICEIGEVLSVEEDDAEGAYIVYSSRYDEIGELPKRAVLFLEDNAERNPLIVLDELEDDDDGYPNAKIKIYLKNNRES